MKSHMAEAVVMAELWLESAIIIIGLSVILTQINFLK